MLQGKSNRPRESENKHHRFNASLPVDLFERLYATAEKEGVTVIELIRRFIKLGLYIIEVQSGSESIIVIRNKNTGDEREILML